MRTPLMASTSELCSPDSQQRLGQCNTRDEPRFYLASRLVPYRTSVRPGRGETLGCLPITAMRGRSKSACALNRQKTSQTSTECT